MNFVAWNGAYESLGEDFYRFFNPRNGLYRDRYHSNPSQKEDVRKFLEGKYDAIIIDRKIFEWYRTHFGNREAFDYHRIFPAKKGAVAVFRSREVRDRFNEGLERIREKGDYERIVRYNLTHDITPLLRELKLLAEISAPYLYNLDPKGLRGVLLPFLKDENILQIRVVDTALDRPFLELEAGRPPQPTQRVEMEIEYPTESEPLKIGKVTILYRKDFRFDRSVPIPDLESFSSLPGDELNRVRRLYEKHGVVKVRHVKLTEAERRFLEKRGTIRAHNERNWAPYNFNVKGQARGFVIDYMNLLAQKLGVKLQFVSGYTWDQFLRLAREKRIDIISNIVDTPERRNYLNFTKPYDISKKAIFSNRPGFRHLRDLKEKTVAVPRGFFIEDYLKRRYPKIRLKRYDNVLQCIQAVLSRKADALIESYGVVRYLLRENSLTLPYVTFSEDSDLQTRLSIGVRKDQPMLREIFQKAIDSVTPEEKRRLKSKWFDVQKKEHNLFTPAQEEYLKRLHSLRICPNPDWKPVEFVEKGKVKGISIDTMRLVAERMRLPLEFVPAGSWAESQENFKAGRCDLLAAAAQTDDRERYAYFTKPYLRYPVAVITRKEAPLVTDFDSIVGKRMARKRGSGLIPLLKREHPSLKVLETGSYEEAFEKVLDREAYFTVATLPILDYYQNVHGLDGLKVAGYLERKLELSVAVSKEKPQLYPIIERALADLPPETHEIIQERWTTPTLVRTTDYSLLLKVLSISLLAIGLILAAYLKLRRLNCQVERLNDTLEERVEEEVRLNRQKDRMMLHQGRLAQMGEMISMIAHQWRQPLNNLALQVQIFLLKHRNGELEEKDLSRFESQSSRLIRQMSETIDDFMNFFKPEKEKREFRLGTVIENVREIMAPMLKKGSIELELAYAKECPILLYGYPNELGQALLNLVSNAREALVERNGERKWIRISVEKEERQIRISVEDNAGGIPEEHLEKLFEPYFSTKEQKNGTGLGLYIGKIVVEDHMGG